MNDIMPCPHCGGGSSVWCMDEYDLLYVTCTKSTCMVRGPFFRKRADAIRAWNRMSLAVQIAEAAWLENAAMEAVDEALADWRDSGDEFDVLDCVRAEKRRLLDEWDEGE